MVAMAKRRLAKSMGDPTKLFHIVGLISALALGVGFVTGLVSVGLSWRINEQQRHELEKLRAGVAKQQERAAKAETDLETERLERLRIEESLAPRMVVDPIQMAGELKKYAGTGVYLSCANDLESIQIESEIESVLFLAGWHILEKDFRPMLMRNIRVDGKSEAARAFAEKLRANKLEVELIPFNPPTNTIRLFIGLKDPSYLRKKRRNELFRSFLFAEPKDPIIEPMREQIQFSHFTAEQQKRFLEEIGKFGWAEKFPVEIRCPANSDRSCELAMEIAVLLRRAGWQVLNNSLTRDKQFPSNVGLMDFPLDENGVAVAARWESQNNSSVAVASALEATDRPVWRTTDIFDSSAPLLILVGIKQPGSK